MESTYVCNGVYIISFNHSKDYISSSIEELFLEEFKAELNISGYDVKKMVFHIRYSDTVDFKLLERIIKRIKEHKKGLNTFWV